MKTFFKGDLVKVTDSEGPAKKPRTVVWVGRVVGPSVFADGWYMVREEPKKGHVASAAPHTVPWFDMEVVRRSSTQAFVDNAVTKVEMARLVAFIERRKAAAK